MQKSFRLGGGEFEREALPRYSVDDARWRFIMASIRIEPQVLRSLLGDATWATTLAGGTPPDPETADRALRGWGEIWHLSEPWCLDWAATQLKLRWGKARGLWPPTSPTEALAAGIALGDMRLVSGPQWKLENLKFAFESEGWDIEREDWQHFKARATKEIMRELSRQLAAYCGQIEERAKAQGLMRTPVKRRSEHFIWLARYQVLGKSYAEIWRSLPREDKRGNAEKGRAGFIEKACKRLAQEIGLSLRRT